MDNLSVLYYRSGLMSELFSKFPEIVLVDGTYNVNKAGMPFYSLMVEDRRLWPWEGGHDSMLQIVCPKQSGHLSDHVHFFSSNLKCSSQLSIFMLISLCSQWVILYCNISIFHHTPF